MLHSDVSVERVAAVRERITQEVAAGQGGRARGASARLEARAPEFWSPRFRRSIMLLEREPFLAELHAARARAGSGEGCVVLVTGEAGIGKTALVERFAAMAEDADPPARVLWGACDALFTPRPLGPLLDIARQARGPLRALAKDGIDRERLFAALLAELSGRPTPTIAVLEDVHWADEATLDLLKFLGRRVLRTHGVVVLTYRDDEVDAAHPLRRVLGELPQAAVRRLRLPPLSEGAVAGLAGTASRAAADLHAITGGNPFYVTEVLAAGDGRIPESVRDAVVARGARLGGESGSVLDVVSVIPGRTEHWLLESVVEIAPAAVDAAVAAGMLRATAGHVAFRHELARRAWEESLPPVRARSLHGRVLEALTDRRDERELLPRLVHHAERCGDTATVLRLAPAAGRAAAAVGAHREAAAHYETALRHADGAPPAVRAGLLDAWSYEVHLAGRMTEAVRAREEALELWRAVGDGRREGDAQRWLSRLTWFEGRREDAAAHAAEAIRVLEPLGPSHELAMAFSTQAQLLILAGDRRAASDWGERAVALAEALDDPEALVHALTNAACLEPGAYRERQLRAVRVAQEHGFHEHALRAYTWAICDMIQEREYATVEPILDEALAYAADRDVDAFSYYLHGWRARLRLEQGRFADAESDASHVLDQETSTVLRLPALTVLGTLATRRGDPGAGEILDRALAAALATGEHERIVPVAAARAEAAWLGGDPEGVRGEVMRAYPEALRLESLWDVGRLASWLRRAGVLESVPERLPGPYAAEMAGDWAEAACGWERRGCPYERALALAEGDEEAQQRGLELLQALGARPAAAWLRRRLRKGGVRGLPRGPRANTREHPAGLTRRQAEVLELLTEGLSNRDIAQRLFLSERTVHHHVSAVLGKLGVESRTAASVLAREKGLVRVGSRPDHRSTTER